MYVIMPRHQRCLAALWRQRQNVVCSQSASLHARMDGPHYLYKRMQFRLLAVSEHGLMAVVLPAYPPAGYTPPEGLLLIIYYFTRVRKSNTFREGGANNLASVRTCLLKYIKMTVTPRIDWDAPGRLNLNVFFLSESIKSLLLSLF